MNRHGRLTLSCLVLVLAALTAGCGAGSTAGGGNDTGDSALWPDLKDVVPGDAFASDHTAKPDLWKELFHQDQTSEDMLPDFGNSDGLTDLDLAQLCPAGEGGLSCPCNENSDCMYDLCVMAPGGKVCAAPCTDECPMGWDCEQLGGGPDIQFFCFPLHSWLCRPCQASSECQVVAGADSGARCVPFGPQGAYCGSDCTAASCPDGYACEEKTSVEGIASKQCVPLSGECDCNAQLALAQATTWCEITNSFGTCKGTWTCLADGMGPCSVQPATAEACNGKDDNCNGVADEGWGGGDCLVSSDFGNCPGVLVCKEGKQECQGIPPGPEQCDGIDQNCDGVADDSFVDTDTDSVADCVDDDDDNDGVGDSFDCEPLNPLVPGCQGRVCGDDGCGGSCGDCLPGYGCQTGACVCLPKCEGKACGPDGCGAACGECLVGFGCMGGKCVCLAKCEGKVCGSDGCGGSCGDCLPGYGCQDGQCVCLPKCEGKVCGSDGCGGSCGSCLPGYGCQAGQCVCQPNCSGKVCGSDGCGGNCGDCLLGYSCQSGQCVCVPNCNGKVCGSDGCGGQCGTCGAGTTCQGGQCVCQPNCTGRDCGTDGCGGSCGTCGAGYACQGGICVCAPNCVGKDCGSDGCGGQCGTCGAGFTCQNGLCACVPNCAGRDCGTDGCGGTCGTCQAGYACQAGKCTCAPNCVGKDCGSDGCGGSCGTCNPGFACQSGKCKCLPNCTGKNCGSDGCGGSCGTCSGGYDCSAAGVCQPPNPCGTLTWNGECEDETTLRYCSANGDAGTPCNNPPNCQTNEVDCVLTCILSGQGFLGFCQCVTGECNCLCL